MKVTWLESDTPTKAPGTTVGAAWPKGALPADQSFARNRKVRTDGCVPGNRHALSVGFGTDWSGVGWCWWTE